jgi:hypothetical protein
MSTLLLTLTTVATFANPLALPEAPAFGAHLLPSEPACEPVDRMPLEGRASPYDSVSVTLGDATVKVCYGRPSARDRTMIGGEHVPFGELWRTGANEPTTLHTTGMISLGGIHLGPGSYSIYTIPGAQEWEVFVSRSTEHWGLAIDDEVRGQEVGSVSVPRENPGEHVETLTLSFASPTNGNSELILEWEDFRIRLPVEAH